MFTSHVPCGDASILLKENGSSLHNFKSPDKICEDVNKSEDEANKIGAKQESLDCASVSSDDYKKSNLKRRNTDRDVIEQNLYNLNESVPYLENTDHNNLGVLDSKCSNEYRTYHAIDGNIDNELSRNGKFKGKSSINQSSVKEKLDLLVSTDFSHNFPIKKQKLEDDYNISNQVSSSETCDNNTQVSSFVETFGFCKDSDSVGNIVADIHRTGAKCLSNSGLQDAKDPGTGYHVVGVVRTKPGRGDPTLSVSCSDKIARWVALGVQGALLCSLLDKPIYMSSITVGGGGPYSAESMQRALVLRSGTEQTPLLLRSNLVFDSSRYIMNKDCKPCASAIMWTNVPERSCEVSARGYRLGATKTAGALEKATRVCRRNLYKHFIQITGERFVKSTYAESKQSSTAYSELWSKVKTCMGSWTEKDPKLVEFTIDSKELS
ncbi:tRNA-specific adenosine deaminase 1-like [Nilaparvata lugens]|uniref:tRNA-specific adenosine deaminase 1-like n=1 Tax=Nilaparvata lugens TaxID=108931 RepID=UPI00193E5679|nr:tRNA-specific adenosine deaminase 1-like [Nilaparvata lugens]